jgi:parallel beta-helix repeat protein
MNHKILSLGICLLLIILFYSGCIEVNDKDLNTLYVDDDGGFDFTTIQEAIDAAETGFTINVKEGTYYEVLIINKTIHLQGKDTETTIIENQDKTEKSVVIIDADLCILEGFTIKGPAITNQTIAVNVNTSNNIISNNIVINADSGIYLGPNTQNNSLRNNIIKNNNYGISTRSSNKNVISSNELSYNNLYGIYLSASNNNKIPNNSVSHCGTGIRIKSSDSNHVYDNQIFENKMGLLCCCGAGNNRIYHNNFIQNEEYNGRDDINNFWDNGTIGNYWDDYTGEDLNGDGIGDTHYEIYKPYAGDKNFDNYPLVNPI